MISWEKGGIAPIYLCENHAAQVGQSGNNCEGSLAVPPQSLRSNHPAEQPKSPVPSGGPADAQVGLGKKSLAVVPAPVSDLRSGDSAKVLADEAIGVAREDFEAYGTVLQRVKPSTATEQKRAERAGLERFCISRYGERCTCEAAVHCPKCGRWFCDVHAEDEKWHDCALAS